MAATHNFQVFDAVGSNMTSDSNYSNDTTRLNGAINGPADPFSFNKAIHQATIMGTAVAQFMAAAGISCDDTNLANLVAAMTQAFVTTASVTYADRAAHGLLGTADVGPLVFCPAQPAPAPAIYTAGSAGNLIGNYHYREVLISGYKNMDGTYFVSGLSPAAQRTAFDVAPSSQKVAVTNLPIGTTGCIGRAIYRSAAGGAAGSEKYCGIVWDNTTTTFADNLTDLQIGTGMPTVQGTPIPANVPIKNTTGTTLDASQIAGAIKSATFGGNTVPDNAGQLQIPMPTADQVGAMRSGTTLPDGINLGSVTVGGSYALPPSVIDGPPDGSANSSQLLVIRGSGQTITQIIGSYSSGYVWTRSGNVVSNPDGGWSRWAKIIGTVEEYSYGDSTPGHLQSWFYRKYPDGIIHYWGFKQDYLTVATPYGNGYKSDGYILSLPTSFSEFTTITVNVEPNDSYPNMILASGSRKQGITPPGTKLNLYFWSPVSLNNGNYGIDVDIWGKWG